MLAEEHIWYIQEAYQNINNVRTSECQRNQNKYIYKAVNKTIIVLFVIRRRMLYLDLICRTSVRG